MKMPLSLLYKYKRRPAPTSRAPSPFVPFFSPSTTKGLCSSPPPKCRCRRPPPRSGSPSYCSSLALRSPRYLLPIVKSCHGDGYVSFFRNQCCLSGAETEIFFVQTFNSINQNSCTVAAYLMSTCNQGSECAVSFTIFCGLRSLNLSLLLGSVHHRFAHAGILVHGSERC
jgi:hypothetical protein